MDVFDDRLFVDYFVLFVVTKVMHQTHATFLGLLNRLRFCSYH